MSLAAQRRFLTAITEVGNNPEKAIQSLTNLKDWSEDDETFPGPLGSSGIALALECICEKVPPFAGARSTYPKFDPRFVTEDFLRGCIALCRKESNFPQWFASVLDVKLEMGITLTLPLAEMVRIRLMRILGGLLLSKPATLLPKFSSMGGHALLISFVTKNDTSNLAKLQFCDFVANMCDPDPEMIKSFMKGNQSELFSVLTNFMKSDNENLRTFSSLALSGVTKAVKSRTVRHGVNMEQFESLLEALQGTTFDLVGKKDVLMSLEKFMHSDGCYRDAMAERADIYLRLIDEITECGSTDAIRRLLQIERAAVGNGTHDDKYWLLYTTINNINSVAGASDARQDKLGANPLLLQRLVHILTCTHDDHRVVETTSIAMYRMLSRSEKNQQQLLRMKETAGIDAVSALLDLFDVDFSRTTQEGTDDTCRGLGEFGNFAGWTHVLGSLNTVLGECFPVYDQGLLERLFGVFQKLFNFWDSPVLKLCDYSFTIMATFMNKMCVLSFPDPHTRLEWMLRCTSARSRKTGTPFLFMYSDFLGRLKSFFPLPEEEEKRIDCIVSRAIRLMRDILDTPEIKQVELSSEHEENRQWLDLAVTEIIARGEAPTSAEDNDSPPIHMCGYPTCGNTYKLKLCGKCKKIAYCGSYCQKKHWPSHKAQCKKK
jgi:MYND finger